MSTTVAHQLDEKITEFHKEFGEELEICSYYAFDNLEDIKGEEDHDKKKELLQEFIWNYSDELDACNSDAFDHLYELAKDLNLEIY